MYRMNIGKKRKTRALLRKIAQPERIRRKPKYMGFLVSE
jgi:hypothetical protein